MTERARRLLSILFRGAICAVAIVWLAHQIEWARLKQVVATAHWPLVLASLAVFGPAPVVLAIRLRWLLAVHGVSLSVWQAIKVTFAGNFIIGALPVGTPGGDAAKAYYVARETPHKHEAVMTVFVDRVIGVISLVGLAGAVCLLNWGNPSFARYGRPISLAVIVMVIGGGVYFSSRLRTLLRVDRLLSYLPLGEHLRRMDQAALEFRNHPGRVAGGLLLTVVLQVIAIVSQFVAGWALGMVGPNPWATFPIYLAFVPICFLAGALPIGAMELIYIGLFADNPGLGTPTAETAMSLSLLNRLTQLLWAMPGLLVVLKMGRPRLMAEPSVGTSPTRDGTHE